MFKKKLEVGKLYMTWNILDMRNEYFVLTEVEIFKVMGYEDKKYDIYMYKSYEKYDEDKPTIMYDYKTIKEKKDLKYCHPIEKINNFTIFDFFFDDEIHL